MNKNMAAMMSSQRIEYLMWGCMGLGVTLSILHKVCGSRAAHAGGKVAKVFVEFQRKSFHMIGG